MSLRTLSTGVAPASRDVRMRLETDRQKDDVRHDGFHDGLGQCFGHDRGSDRGRGGRRAFPLALGCNGCFDTVAGKRLGQGLAAGDSDLFRKLFETVLARSIKERIVGGEAFGVEASMIVADANRQRGVARSRTRFDVQPRGRRGMFPINDQAPLWPPFFQSRDVCRRRRRRGRRPTSWSQPGCGNLRSRSRRFRTIALCSWRVD